jgi:hypothetical protein
VEGADASAGTATPPKGWYPDPGGMPQWRRWEGTSWSESTMQFSPPMPDELSLERERVAWSNLRPVAPWALAAPALAAISLASKSSQFAAFRRWIRTYLTAELHHRTLPTLAKSTLPANSTLDSLITISVTLLMALGLFAWLRFSTSSIRVASAATYPQRHGPVATSASMVVPILGPLVASAASRANLPAGHEARRVLALGWGCIVAGEAAFVGLYATVLWTSSLAFTWAVAALCVLAWAAAAYQLPLGLQAIAEDHESMNVRLRRMPS